MDERPTDLKVVESYSAAVEDANGASMVGYCWHHGNGWFVVVPGGADAAGDPALVDLTTWAVSGDAPYLTVTPSINVIRPGGWHGWITDGLFVLAGWN